MIRKIQRHWFEVWGDEEAQNRILKYMLLVMAFLSTVQLVIIIRLATAGPLLILPGAIATQTIRYGEPPPEILAQELTRVIDKYLRTRHNWDPSTIEAQTKLASAYVAKDFREKFALSAQEQIRLAKEKQVAQRFYPEPLRISMGERKATVSAERILIIGGIQAAQAMNFELEFAYGDRSEQNPEGVYITSEKLVTAQ